MSTPKLSIITITFNAQHTLERTIASVEAQSFPGIEYIIVDGASSDSTPDIVRRHAGSVSRFVSEPDDGLYFAMNKGLDLASGDYVWFLNAGDELPSPDTVADMFRSHPDADVYYGHTMITADDGSEIGLRRLAPPESLSWRSFAKGMLVSHQSFVPRRALCPHYDTSYAFSADFDWCVRILKASSSIVNTHMTLSRFLDGGITKQNISRGLRERFRIMCRFYGFLPTLWHHLPIAAHFFAFWLSRGRF